jgi:hypothetical protein
MPDAPPLYLTLSLTLFLTLILTLTLTLALTLTLTLIMTLTVTLNASGIVVGHAYFFLEDIYPQIAELRQWRSHPVGL